MGSLFKLSLGFHSRVSYQYFFSRLLNVQVLSFRVLFKVSFRVSFRVSFQVLFRASFGVSFRVSFQVSLEFHLGFHLGFFPVSCRVSYRDFLSRVLNVQIVFLGLL